MAHLENATFSTAEKLLAGMLFAPSAGSKSSRWLSKRRMETCFDWFDYSPTRSWFCPPPMSTARV
jgi:hypothetical protein